MHILAFVCFAILATLMPRSAAAADAVATQTPASSSARLTILVVHGPNMNLLGRREPEIYGSMTLDQVNERLRALASTLGVDVVIVQSNHEGVIVDTFQQHMDDVDGAIINAAGLSFHSVPIHDVIKAMPYPVIEVHMSNLGTRDAIHQGSLITPAVHASVMGFGWRSYTAALGALVEHVRELKGGTK